MTLFFVYASAELLKFRCLLFNPQHGLQVLIFTSVHKILTIASENSQHFKPPSLVSWGNKVGETSAEFHTNDMSCHNPDLGSASDCSCTRELTPTSQKRFPYLISYTSSAWNFCARSSDFISRGNQWWRSEMSTGCRLFHQSFMITTVIFSVTTSRAFRFCIFLGVPVTISSHISNSF